MFCLFSSGFLLKKSFLLFVILKSKLFFHAILWNLLCSLLLYKQLPNKVKLLGLILNVYFIGFQLFSEEKLYSSTSLNSKYCIAYRNNIASRRNIRTYSGTRRGFLWCSDQRCWINWNSEPRFGRTPVYWLHRHLYRQAPEHNPIISNYATYHHYLFVHLSCWSWLKTLVA